MTTQLRHTFGLGLLLLAGAVQAADVTIDLYARTGSTTLPDGNTPFVVGYVTAPDGTVTAPGGPVLEANVGDVVTINLHNQLSEPTALLLQGQPMIPDAIGVGSGGSKAYVFTAGSPGTYLYEAGLLPNAQHQVAMGLHGALVVRPATAGQAYDGADSAYDDEAVLVLSEIDPDLNDSANPAAFDMRDFAPTYFLINGKAYPATETVPTAAGNRVLLRYVNAGVQHHSMTLLGTSQVVVAKDGSPLAHPGSRVAESVAPGQTMDAIATMPADSAAGSRFALFDGSMSLFNAGSPGFGGMLTFLVAGTSTPPGGDVTGPATTGVALTPNPTNGTVAVTISASVSDVATGNSNVTAAEYDIDGGVPVAMSGGYGSPTVAVTATIPAATLASLASGNHTVHVRGQDGAGNWGSANFASLNLDKAGPSTAGLTLTPNPSNGTVSVAVHATGDDSASGGSNVIAAEYFVGATGADGTGTAMTVNAPSPIASLDATILPPVTGGVVSVHARDALGNWGAFATITLAVTSGGPTTSNVSAAPNPNNGMLPLNSSNPSVRVTATVASQTAAVSGAEGFIDTVGTDGTGFPFIAGDGAWNGGTESVYADVPLTTVNQLSTGNHTIHVHGRDAAGNWGATATTILVIDRTPPSFTNASLAPTTAVIGEAVILTVTGGADVAGGQYWIDGSATPPANATAFTGTTAALTATTGGVHTVYVRVRDAAGNWTAVRSVTLTVPSAVDDAVTITANTNRTQGVNEPTVLGNDLPIGTPGRTATLVSGPVRTGGNGAGTIRVSCGNSTTTGVCAGGSYRVTLTGVGSSGNARRASKRGTYQFTYTETLNGKTTAPATVAITVN